MSLRMKLSGSPARAAGRSSRTSRPRFPSAPRAARPPSSPRRGSTSRSRAPPPGSFQLGLAALTWMLTNRSACASLAMRPRSSSAMSVSVVRVYFTSIPRWPSAAPTRFATARVTVLLEHGRAAADRTVHAAVGPAVPGVHDDELARAQRVLRRRATRTTSAEVRRPARSRRTGALAGERRRRAASSPAPPRRRARRTSCTDEKARSSKRSASHTRFVATRGRISATSCSGTRARPFRTIRRGGELVRAPRPPWRSGGPARPRSPRR